MIMIKEIKGSNGKYTINENGVVFSNYTQKEMSLSLDKDGYKKVQMYINGKRVLKRVNRLVYETFVGDIPEGLVVDHIDNDRQNNCISNLRLLSTRENVKRGKHNVLGIQGVYQNRDKYIASICINGKSKYIGTFATPEEAKTAYENAVSKGYDDSNKVRLQDHKICRICGIDKPITDFYVRKNGWRFYCCKECYKQQRKQTYNS